jgi:hypothetical protein
MKTPFELHLACFLRIQALCLQYNTQLMALIEYPALKTLFNDIVKKICDARDINEAYLKNIAEAKAAALATMIDTVFGYMLRAAVKANALGDVSLEASLSFPKNYLLNCDDATVEVRASAIKDVMKNNLSVLDNLVQSDIDKMEQAIKDYKILEAMPKDSIEYRKAMGTDPIPLLTKKGDKAKKNIGKLFHSYLPEAAHLFDVAARIGKSTGQRHISLAVQFTDALTKMVLRGIKCTFTNGVDTVTKNSTVRGWVRLYSLGSGNWSFTAESSTHQSVSAQDIAVDDKHVAKFFIPLQKKSDIDPSSLTGILNILVLDKATNLPLSEVDVSVSALHFSAKTDKLGEVHKDLLPVGSYMGSVFLKDYDLLEFFFTIESGKATSLTLRMQKSF